MDFGHTDPQWILPLGVKAEIDCHKKEFKMIEKIFYSLIKFLIVIKFF